LIALTQLEELTCVLTAIVFGIMAGDGYSIGGILTGLFAYGTAYVVLEIALIVIKDDIGGDGA
jgi:hypothetical protein